LLVPPVVEQFLYCNIAAFVRGGLRVFCLEHGSKCALARFSDDFIPLVEGQLLGLGKLMLQHLRAESVLLVLQQEFLETGTLVEFGRQQVLVCKLRARIRDKQLRSLRHQRLLLQLVHLRVRNKLLQRFLNEQVTLLLGELVALPHHV
jgi:hypothetical protein